MTEGGFSQIDPYGGGQSIDPYGGHDPESPNGTQTNVPIPDPGGKSWRTWRIKGAFDQWSTLPRVLPYLKPYKKLYLVVFLTIMVASLVALAEPWPFALILDSVLADHPPGLGLSGIFGDNPNPYTLLVFIVVGGFLITIIGHSIEVVNNYASARLEQNMVLDLRSKLFQHCQRLSLTFHDDRYTGQLMSIINLQASAVGSVIMAFPPIVQNALTLVGMLVIALLISWQVTLISLVVVPLIYYASGLYGTRIVPRIQQVMSLEWRSLSIVFEAMSMLRVIVSFGREKYEHRRFRDQAKTAVDARVKLTVSQTFFTLGVTAATAFGTALVLGFGTWYVLRGNITVGELVVLISYITAVYQPMEQIGTQIGHLHQQFVFVNAALMLLDDVPEVSDAPDAQSIARAQGGLTFENVSFAYEGRVDTLKGISFDVKPGERVAIVGPTGAGKTTLINLLVRFYEFGEGKILIDDRDIRKVKLESVRQNVSLVMQQPMLFSGTIAENIRYGRLDATMDEIVEAAKSANAHEFILGLPDGYETSLGEGGMQLSGGERQRLCVARAFIKDAPILVLDEPTSSIDSKTENVILEALDDLMVGRTSFMIAHRLSTIHDADRILVMNHGELVEQGSHDELLARGGLYSQLHTAQTRHKARRGAAVPAGIPGPETSAPPVAAPTGPPAGPPVSPQVEPLPGPPAEPVEEPPLAPTPTPPVRERVAAAVAEAHRAPPPDDADGPPPREPNGVPPKRPNGPPPRKVKISNGVRHTLHCDVCGRTLLKGEIAEPFAAPPSGRRKPEPGLDTEFDGPFLTDFRRMGQTERKLVCELCWPHAEEQGWTPLPMLGGPS